MTSVRDFSTAELCVCRKYNIPPEMLRDARFAALIRTQIDIANEFRLFVTCGYVAPMPVIGFED